MPSPGEQHDQPVHAQAEAAHRRRAVLQRPEEVLVEGCMASTSPAAARRDCSVSTARWITGSMSSLKAVPALDTADDQVPGLDETRVRTMRTGQRLRGGG